MASTRIRTGWGTLIQALIEAQGAGTRARILLEGVARESWIEACGLWRLEESTQRWNCLLARGPAERLHGGSFLEEVAAGRSAADLVPGRGVLIAGQTAGALALTFAGRPESETELDLLSSLLHVVRLANAADVAPEEAHAESYVPALPRLAESTPSRISSNSTCVPAELLERLVDGERAACELAHVRLELEIEPGVRACTVDMSGEEFVRACRNLLQNAREAQEHATESGRIRVQLHAIAGETLVLTIEDAGPGMPQGAVSALEACNPDALPGPGLGLAISWGIAQGAGGALRVLRSCEHGSCLEIRLPITCRS